MKVKDAESWLAGRGYREVPSGSRKYRKFVGGDGPETLWLGKSGAVRSGRTVSESGSISWNVEQQVKREAYEARTGGYSVCALGHYEPREGCYFCQRKMERKHAEYLASK